MEFRRPHPWSTAAAIVPVAARPSDGCDGLLLWTGPVVLGPDSDSHVRCEDWTETLAVFRWDDGPRWRRIDPTGGRLDEGEVNRLEPGTLIERETARVYVDAAD